MLFFAWILYYNRCLFAGFLYLWRNERLELMNFIIEQSSELISEQAANSAELSFYHESKANKVMSVKTILH